MKRRTHLATVAPTMRWNGWRPSFLKHNSDQRAGHLLLVLDREGETMLLPCAQASYCFAFPAWDDWAEADALRQAWGDGADADLLDQAVSSLEADGWRVVGRLVIEFAGVDAEADFWLRVRANLAGGGNAS